MNEAMEQLLRAFCAEVGIDDAEAVVMSAEVVIDGLAVQMLAQDEDGESLTLFADLGVPDAARRADVHRQLLEANLLWNATGGAILGVHPATAAVGLAARLPLPALDGKMLAEAVARFVTVAEHWQTVVAGRDMGNAAMPATLSPADAMGNAFMLRG